MAAVFEVDVEGIESGASRDTCELHGPPERVKESHLPSRNGKRALLRALEHGEVVLALALDLRGQAVEALRAAVSTRHKQLTHGACDTYC